MGHLELVLALPVCTSLFMWFNWEGTSSVNFVILPPMTADEYWFLIKLELAAVCYDKTPE